MDTIHSTMTMSMDNKNGNAASDQEGTSAPVLAESARNGMAAAEATDAHADVEEDPFYECEFGPDDLLGYC